MKKQKDPDSVCWWW